MITFFLCLLLHRVKLDVSALLAAKETQATEYDIELILLLQAHLYLSVLLPLYNVFLMLSRVPMVTLETLVNVVSLELTETRYAV